MNTDYVYRALRAFFPALIMFLSCRWLGVSHQQALFAAAAPMVLGTLNILRGKIFGLTACVFILAIIAHVFPTQYKIAQEIIAGRVNEERAAVEARTANVSISPSPSVSGSGVQTIQAPVLSGSNIPIGPIPVITGSTAPTTPVPEISGSSPLAK